MALHCSCAGQARDRRGDDFLLASSYGAVYGMLRQDGQFLHIADAINGRDHAYDLTAGGVGRRIPVTDAMRAEERSLIRERS